MLLEAQNTAKKKTLRNDLTTCSILHIFKIQNLRVEGEHIPSHPLVHESAKYVLWWVRKDLSEATFLLT
jgi:hypothetical protein